MYILRLLAKNVKQSFIKTNSLQYLVSITRRFAVKEVILVVAEFESYVKLG